MKPLVYIFFIFVSLPASQVYGGDEGTESINKYEVLIREYQASEENSPVIEVPSVNQVVIYDAKGHITRQADIKGEVELSTPAILKPVINKAVFLTKISGIYYYLYDKN
jgi:hypothetical protein